VVIVVVIAIAVVVGVTMCCLRRMKLKHEKTLRPGAPPISEWTQEGHLLTGQYGRHEVGGSPVHELPTQSNTTELPPGNTLHELPSGDNLVRNHSEQRLGMG
jgi:hypothetical protein